MRGGKKWLIIIVVALLLTSKGSAQNAMRIHYKNGFISEFPISEVDSITFTQDCAYQQKDTLSGSWLWGDAEAGYYELLTFNDDKAYTGSDNYFTYGFDTMTYGWYRLMGSMLTLQSNGFGYNRRYDWFVVGLTGNALDVMTKMGRFIYYKLQPEIIYLHINEEHHAGDDGNSFVFADGTIANIIDGKLKGMAVGTSYTQKYVAGSNLILAYKVVVIRKFN